MQILVFILIFGIIVTIHEFGHFYFAKRAGILVREFAIGMGPKLFEKRHNGTTYTIRVLPVGGYVRLAGMGDDVEPLKAGQLVTIVQNEMNVVTCINTNTKKQLLKAVPFEIVTSDLEKELFIEGYLAGQTELTRLSVDREATLIEETGVEIQIAPLDRQYQSAPVLQRMLVNFAGPLNNFLLGIFIFSLLAFMSGSVPTDRNAIGTVEPNSAAYQAGLKAGDTIVSINGTKTNTWSDITKVLTQSKKEQPNQPVDLIVKHENNSEQNYSIALTNGVLGITTQVDSSFFAKLSYGFTASWKIATSILTTLAGMFTRGFDINQFGGPVAIAQMSSKVTDQGFLAILGLMGALSVNLGVMNLLPLPVLDGGKLVLNIIEALRGKPVSPEKENLITIVSSALLILLMIAVTFNDLHRVFFK